MPLKNKYKFGTPIFKFLTDEMVIDNLRKPLSHLPLPIKTVHLFFCKAKQFLSKQIK